MLDVVVVDVVVVSVVEVVVVVSTASQWSSFPLALPWSSQSCPFSFGSGRQSLSDFPCEQLSPGDPGLVGGGPPPGLPGSASAADAATPATSSPASTRTFAACSFSRATPKPWLRS